MKNVFFWRVRHFLDDLGWPGCCALLFLGMVVALDGLILTPMHRDIVALQAQAGKVRKQSIRLFEQKAVLNPVEQLAAFYEFFPVRAGMADYMEKIYGAALEQGVILERGDYQLANERDSQLVRYDIVFPVKGGYVSIRKFVAAVLNATPHVSLEGMVFNRQRIDDPMIDVQLKFALFLRP